MKKISVELCNDHFERLKRDDVCNTCPSRVENENIVKAMAKAMEDNPEGGRMAVANELRNIRGEISTHSKKIQALDEAIRGNGKEGINQKITSIQSTMKANKSMTIIGLTVVSIIFVILSFILNLNK